MRLAGTRRGGQRGSGAGRGSVGEGQAMPTSPDPDPPATLWIRRNSTSPRQHSTSCRMAEGRRRQCLGSDLRASAPYQPHPEAQAPSFAVPGPSHTPSTGTSPPHVPSALQTGAGGADPAWPSTVLAPPCLQPTSPARGRSAAQGTRRPCRARAVTGCEDRRGMRSQGKPERAGRDRWG